MQDYSHPTTTEKNHRSIGFVYIIPLGLTAGFIIFALVFVLREQPGTFSFATQTTPKPTLQTNQLVTATPTIRVSPSPTTMPTQAALKKDEVVIRVLNGSGTVGVAAKAKQALIAGGFTNVTTGNASKFDYKNITIRYKQEAKGSLSSLKEALMKTSTLESEETAELSGKTMVEIIVGTSTALDEK